MSTTPAFSPIPASSLPIGVVGSRSPNWRRCTLEDLYEQCSDHITEYMASSDEVGRRPRISRIRAYSSDFRPSSAHGCAWSGVPRALSTVSTTGQRYRLVRNRCCSCEASPRTTQIGQKRDQRDGEDQPDEDPGVVEHC